MSDETALLPCLFCKGKAELKEYKPNVSGVAICKKCGARSPICKNDHTGGWKPKAIEAWNTRTPEQVIAAELGGGECEIETTESWLPAERYHRCKHCGAFFAVMNASGDIPPCVCPNCGKAVKR